MTETYPGWSKAARFVVVTAAFFIVIGGLRAAAEILGPLLLAIFFSILIYPAIQWLKARGLSNALSFAALFLAVVVVGIAFMLFFYLSLGQLQDNLPVYQNRLSSLTGAMTQLLEDQGVDISNIDQISALNPERLTGAAASLITVLFGQISIAFMVLLLLIFILAEAGDFPAKVERAFGSNNPVINNLATFGRSVKAFSRIRTISNLFVGVAVTILLLFLGVDLAYLWGFLAFFLSYIPAIGFIIAAVPAVILAILEQSLATGLIVIVGMVVINGISDNIIAPRLSAQALNLSPFSIFFSFVFWGWILGPVGAVLSVVLTLGIKLILDAHPETKAYSVMLGSSEEFPE